MTKTKAKEWATSRKVKGGRIYTWRVGRAIIQRSFVADGHGYQWEQQGGGRILSAANGVATFGPLHVIWYEE